MNALQSQLDEYRLTGLLASDSEILGQLGTGLIYGIDDTQVACMATGTCSEEEQAIAAQMESGSTSEQEGILSSHLRTHEKQSLALERQMGISLATALFGMLVMLVILIELCHGYLSVS